MWIRHKKGAGWADWVWIDVDLDRFQRIRVAVRDRFAEYVLRVIGAGEQLIDADRARRGVRRIMVPLGFTANDFVTDVARGMGQKVDFFNVRCFFQTVQTASGDYPGGPVKPMRRYDNALLSPAAGCGKKRSES